MESATKDKKPQPPLPDGAPEAVEKAAEGKKVTAEEEVDALDFLLGPTTSLQYEVEVELDTKSGPKKLVFVIRQLDGKRILDLEERYRTGDGPFGRLDNTSFNAALVAEATVEIKDGETGKSADPRSQEFRGPVPDPADAMRARFQFQSGLLVGVAAEIRRIAGEAPDRVGQAQRAMVNAAGSS